MSQQVIYSLWSSWKGNKTACLPLLQLLPLLSLPKQDHSQVVSLQTGIPPQLPDNRTASHSHHWIWFNYKHIFHSILWSCLKCLIFQGGTTTFQKISCSSYCFRHWNMVVFRGVILTPAWRHSNKPYIPCTTIYAQCLEELGVYNLH